MLWILAPFCLFFTVHLNCQNCFNLRPPLVVWEKIFSHSYKQFIYFSIHTSRAAHSPKKPRVFCHRRGTCGAHKLHLMSTSACPMSYLFIYTYTNRNISTHLRFCCSQLVFENSIFFWTTFHISCGAHTYGTFCHCDFDPLDDDEKIYPLVLIINIGFVTSQVRDEKYLKFSNSYGPKKRPYRLWEYIQHQKKNWAEERGE